MTAPSQPSAVQAALGWLQTGKAPPARAPEVARALALLGGQAAPTPALLKGLAADLEAALLAEAEARQAVALVRLVADHAADKPVAKQAKKVLFKWKQQGIDVPDRAGERSPVSLGARPEPLPRFASSLDAQGGQIIFLGGWSAHDGPWCVMGMLTERDGLMSAYRLPHTSRTQQRELLTRLHDQLVGFTAEVPAEFAAGRLRWALEVRQASSTLFDGDVAEVRQILEGVEPVPEVELALDAAQESELAGHLAASAGLANERCFGAWFDLPAPQLEALRQQVAAVRAEPDAGSRATALAVAAWSAWLDAGERIRWAARIDINAWLLHCTGRSAVALQAIATARALRAGDAVGAIPLVAAAVARQAPVAQWLAQG